MIFHSFLDTKDIQAIEIRSLKSLSTPKFTHRPVLLEEVLDLLPIEPGSIIIDATLGLGGHSKEILKKVGKNGKLYGFDWDERNRNIAAENLKESLQCEIIPKSFSHIEEELEKRGVSQVDGILFDLGISSAHLDDASRGFSFRLSGPLDLRMDTSQGTPASYLIQNTSEFDLAKIFFEYGEERNSRKIAKTIVYERKNKKIETTDQLYAILEDISWKPKKTAARIFQALRIAVNHELEEIEKTLPQAISLLRPGGRVAVISFHSLEDRIVKQFFREKERAGHGQRINKKVIIPGTVETAENPRARSAKMRVFEKKPFPAQI